MFVDQSGKHYDRDREDGGGLDGSHRSGGSRGKKKKGENDEERGTGMEG